MTKTYQSKDFYLASFLVASGFPLLASRKEEGLTIFQFEETPKLTDSITSYYNFSATINPIILGNSMRSLKSIIHANSNSYGTDQYQTRTGKV